ncbi:hypothetical protein CH330_06855 [candidate division WOR-3 bacterium JGI_Cruoil_03_51_56]|uniref:PKD domain-containing protein n=1 Tax=candidate division WOR-3 bacterium JGI_Cruoil_03_51_56 TaxID=1973747 RepID=A0A235BS32_UNCW3|nr:MAG: hypothetical protein CH330_06855 [candidate division WOR-3 bacterium JGI_Cruoil_03_51_56]
MVKRYLLDNQHKKVRLNFSLRLFRDFEMKLVYAVAFLFLVIMPGCLGERAPRAPVIDGPNVALPGDTVRFWACSSDPNSGNLSYLFDWGDSTVDNWTAELASGDTLFRTHIYSDTGNYVVQVRSHDKTGLESEWSLPLDIAIAFTGPLIPEPPQGPAQVYKDTAYWFETAANHIRKDSISIQFDWGDTLGGWTDFVRAGEPVSDSHTFRFSGSYFIQARARDRAGSLSLWSLPETVVVTRRPLEPPRNITLVASSGVNVRLRWQTGRNSDSVKYDLWFRPLGSDEFKLIETVMGNTVFHDPSGGTGDYTVSARREGEEVFAADTLSTIPILTDTLMLYELNTAGKAGYGWDRLNCLGSLYSMEDSTQAPFVDFYFTDLEPGSSGPCYYLASPHIGPDDPGGLVPGGSWRRSGLLDLWGNIQGPLPAYDSLFYTNIADVTVSETYVAIYTADRHYALVFAAGPNPGSATIPVVCWFQKVPGLRLIQHKE